MFSPWGNIVGNMHLVDNMQANASSIWFKDHIKSMIMFIKGSLSLILSFFSLILWKIL